MTAHEYEKLLKTGLPGGVYYFYGAEQYKKEQLLRKTEKEILPEGFELLNEAVLDNADMQTITDEAMALPFMSEKRLVIAKDPTFIVKPGNANAAATKDFVNWSITAPASAVVIVYLREEMDKRQSSFLTIKGEKNFVEFSLPSEYEVENWIVSEVSSRNCKIDSDSASELAAACLYDRSHLIHEIEKLCAYRQNSAISFEDIEEIVSTENNDESYKIIDYILNNKTQKAYELIDKLLVSGEGEYILFIGLVSQLRLMTHTKLLARSSAEAKDYAYKLGLKNPYPAQKAYEFAVNFDFGTIAQCYRQCVQLDNDIKNGTIGVENALHEAIIKMERFSKLSKTGNKARR